MNESLFRGWAVAAAVAALTMAGVDVVWLGFVAKGLFQKEIGHLLAKDINFVAAGLFYVFYVTTILVRASLRKLVFLSTSALDCDGTDGVYTVYTYLKFEINDGRVTKLPNIAPMTKASFQIYAVRPSRSAKDAALRGAGLGFVAYTTYELTNWAVLEDWGAILVPIDIAWGVALTTTTAVASYVAGSRLSSSPGT